MLRGVAGARNAKQKLRDNCPLPPTFRLAYWDHQLIELTRERANLALPPASRALYESICARAGDPRGGGVWDVIGWQGDDRECFLFVEWTAK